jgi:hypothetical protein
MALMHSVVLLLVLLNICVNGATEFSSKFTFSKATTIKAAVQEMLCYGIG